MIIPTIISYISKELNIFVIVIIIFFGFIVNIIIKDKLDVFNDYIKSKLYKKYKYDIIIEGTVITSAIAISKIEHIPIQFNAMTHFLLNEYNIYKIKYYYQKDLIIHGLSPKDNKLIKALHENIMINNIPLIEGICIEKNIFLETKNNIIKNDIASTEIYTIRLCSNETNLYDFVKLKTRQYEEYLEKINNNKIFHFIFDNNTITSQLLFTIEPFSKTNYENFDHIFNEHTEIIKNDIIKLKNIDYYNKMGMRRKKGYLFYGDYGTGKTATITAISLFDNRHILEIPFSKIKSNEDIDKILNLSIINDIKFKKEQLIIVFDEIDKYLEEKVFETNEIKESTSLLKNKIIITEFGNITANCSKKISNDIEINPKLNDFDFGYLLTRLDGIGNYDGLIIIATTNDIDIIPPALYRDMRLTKIKFDYLRKIDIINMIQKYFEIILTEDQIEKLPVRDDKIVGSTIKNLIDIYIDNFDEFINKVYKLKKL